MEFLDENCAFAALSQSSGLTLHDKRLVVKPREVKSPSKSKARSKKPAIAKPIASKKPLQAPRSKIMMEADHGTCQREHSLFSDDVLGQLNSVHSVSPSKDT